MKKSLVNYRVDDLPILYGFMGILGIKEAIDGGKTQHGNWSGVSAGEIVSLWLCYIISESDHRLQSVEAWAEANLDFLRVLCGNKLLQSSDFTDDRLGYLLGYLGNETVWQGVEVKINEKSLGIYRFENSEGLSTIRLDAAPMQSYGKSEPGGLLQYGYSKQHADLPQFKIKLATLDNELNHFAYPITHLTVSGNKSDDELYLEIIKQSKVVLGSIPTYEKYNLYVGDSKFGAIANRAYVSKSEDYYLMPLSLVQLSKTERQKLIKTSDKSTYQRVEKTEDGETILVAEGFELTQVLDYEVDGEVHQWTERRLFVQSEAYAKSQRQAFDARVEKTITALEELGKRGQGKKVLTSSVECQAAIDNLLKQKDLEGFLTTEITVEEVKKECRAYGGKPERTEITLNFSVKAYKSEALIAEHKLLLGWQVYATNVPLELLSFENCVWKYRHQSNIESRFDDLRNKLAPLLPVFLQKDERIKGLVNLLLLALKLCAVLEYKIAQKLQENQELLYNVYEGNPKRGTNRPSSKRILNAFKGVSLSLIFVDYKLQLAIMSDLEPVQRKILELLNLDLDIYTKLEENIQIFFSQNFFSET